MAIKKTPSRDEFAAELKKSSPSYTECKIYDVSIFRFEKKDESEEQ